MQAALLAEKLNIDPFKIMLHFAAGDWKALGYDSPTEERIADGGITLEIERITPQMRLQAAEKAAKYLYPTLKATEIKIDSDTKKSIGSYEEFIIARNKERKRLEEQKIIEDAVVIPYDKKKTNEGIK